MLFVGWMLWLAILLTIFSENVCTIPPGFTLNSTVFVCSSALANVTVDVTTNKARNAKLFCAILVCCYLPITHASALPSVVTGNCDEGIREKHVFALKYAKLPDVFKYKHICG